MHPQSRLGDRSLVPEDSHGKACCAHKCIGPATTGSPDVFVNRQAALRVNDQGVHSQCCGENTWVAISGSSTVMINTLAAHRQDDQDQHCGGVGNMIEGSPDVKVGG
jgi:uncharacterized Zn-binding protein involved in type VI secretion